MKSRRITLLLAITGTVLTVVLSAMPVAWAMPNQQMGTVPTRTPTVANTPEPPPPSTTKPPSDDPDPPSATSTPIPPTETSVPPTATHEPPSATVEAPGATDTPTPTVDDAAVSQQPSSTSERVTATPRPEHIKTPTLTSQPDETKAGALMSEHDETEGIVTATNTATVSPTAAAEGRPDINGTERVDSGPAETDRQASRPLTWLWVGLVLLVGGAVALVFSRR